MTDRSGPNLTLLVVGLSGMATAGLLAAGAIVLALHIAAWTAEMRACAEAGPEVCAMEVQP